MQMTILIQKFICISWQNVSTQLHKSNDKTVNIYRYCIKHWLQISVKANYIVNHKTSQNQNVKPFPVPRSNHCRNLTKTYAYICGIVLILTN